MKNKYIDSIIAAGGKVYQVGGVVRDTLLGLTEHKDHDYLVTGLPLDELQELLSGLGHVDLVGKSFGVLKFKPHGYQGEAFDIALPRKEVSIGSGHQDFEVKCDHNLSVEEDLGRRDFTINAMAIELPEGNLIDPYGGQEDIAKRQIRLVFPKAFEEDPLRMLRAVQFAARLKFWIEQETLDSIKEHSFRIATVSGERVFEELKKILLLAELPSRAFWLMKEGRLLRLLFPELATCLNVLQPRKYHIKDVYEHIMCAVDAVPSTKLHVRLAALFHDISKPETYSEEYTCSACRATTLVGPGDPSVLKMEVCPNAVCSAQIDHERINIHFYEHEYKAMPVIDQIMDRLHAPKDLTEKVKKLVANHMFAGDFKMSRRAMRRLISRVGPELIYDLVDLRVGDRIASGKAKLSMGKIGYFKQLIDQELAEPAFSVKNLKIGGGDLIGTLEMKQGPGIGVVLNKLLELVMDDPTLNTEETLLELAKGIISSSSE